MRVTILAVGKLRDAWVKEGCEEYARRLSRRMPLEVIEVKRPDELERRLPPRQPVWALDPRGRELSSEELAEAVRRHRDGGEGGITFVLGGPDGLPAALVARAAFRWSFGKLTLPHRLARLILCEQLYRAASILAGEPYHRA